MEAEEGKEQMVGLNGSSLTEALCTVIALPLIIMASIILALMLLAGWLAGGEG